MTQHLVKADYLEMFRRMQTIRRFEETAENAFKRGEFLGSCHSAIGQEATSVGACYGLKNDDIMLGTHRGHGHVIAKGGDVNALMAEMYGKATGCAKGKAGSMHVQDLSVGAMGECGILGSHVPAAVGLALAMKMRGEPRVSLAFFGDGAAQEGTVHEAMNLASVWKAPVIFLCENNGYFNYVRTRDRCSVPQFVQRAPAYGMPGTTADGQDVLAVYSAAQAAVDRARRGEGPSMVECFTYRYRAHAFLSGVGGEQEERPQEEMDYWLGRDPIKLFRLRLLAEEWATEADLTGVEAGVEQAVKEAQTFARNSPSAELKEVFLDTYADLSPLARYLARQGVQM